MSTDPDRDEQLAHETIAAAVSAGITVFDTAHAYGRNEFELGHNERLLAEALKRAGGADTARIVTKGGMSRPGGAWVPDGRAKKLREDCEASVSALDGLEIDTFLIHAPDPRTPWRTSMRALARISEERLAKRVGVSNVNRLQLDEALELAPISAVEVALSLLEDRAVRGGVLERCEELGIAVIAHSPLGGPRKAHGLRRREAFSEIANKHSASPAEVALAWLLELSPQVVTIPGARRPQTATSSASAASLRLTPDQRTTLARAHGWAGTRTKREPHSRRQADVVIVMGIPGAGKTRIAESYINRNYARLNRDERGGSLAELARALDEALETPVPGVVLDNTYLTRAARSHVIEAAARYGMAVRCIWLKTPLAQAQVNMVQRILDVFDGVLPTPAQLKSRARGIPGLLTPTSQMRALRELEPPSLEEGFTELEVVEFGRSPSTAGGRGVFLAASALQPQKRDQALGATRPPLPHLVFDWQPDGDPEALAPLVAQLASNNSGPVEAAVCPHPAGPPICWCRPPLPGLPLAFARAYDLAPSRCTVIGTSAAHRTLANTLGARFVAV